MKEFFKKNRYFLISCISILFVLLVWYVLCDVMHVVKTTVFPGPEKVWQTFIKKLYKKSPDNATLGQHLLSSLQICFTGYLLGAAVGIPIGIAMAWNKWCDRLIRPVFDLVRPVPGLAWIPLFILLFGIGTTAKAMVIFLNSMIACTVNSYTGIRQTDQLHLWVGDVFGATSMQKLFRIAIPTALPMIFTGLRTAFGGSWMALVAAEMLASSKGLGFMIQNARVIARPDLIIIGMLTIGSVGLIFDIILQKLEILVSKGLYIK